MNVIIIAAIPRVFVLYCRSIGLCVIKKGNPYLSYLFSLNAFEYIFNDSYSLIHLRFVDY